MPDGIPLSSNETVLPHVTQKLLPTSFEKILDILFEIIDLSDIFLAVIVERHVLGISIFIKIFNVWDRSISIG